MNIFEGKSKEWLLQQREALQEAMASTAGGQTQVALAPGMSDSFVGLTTAELRKKLEAIQLALHLLEPNTYAHPRRMKIHSTYPHSY
jgi:hypothetical protein